MKRLSAVLFACLALSCLMLSGCTKPSDAAAPVLGAGPPPSIATLGVTSLTLSTTNAFNLSSGTNTLGTSTPCNNMLLSVTGTAVLVGSSSSNCAFTVPTGLPAIYFPANDVNQIWVKTSASGTGSVISAAYGH